MKREDLSEQDKAYTPYWALLKDPRWQRKRLETLESVGWECENCGGKENTLHVHHKRYIKGRKPWEYQPDDLSVLCEACHENHHHVSERIKGLLAIVDLPSALALLTGHFARQMWMDDAIVQEGKKQDALTFAMGFTSSLFEGDIDKIHSAAEFIVSLSRETSEERQLFEHNQDVFGK